MINVRLRALTVPALKRFGSGEIGRASVFRLAQEREQLAAIVADCNRPRKHGGQQRFAESGVDGLLRDNPQARQGAACNRPITAPIAAETTARVAALTPAFARAGFAPHRRTRRPTVPAGRWPPCLRGRLQSATIAANCSRSAALKTTHTVVPWPYPPGHGQYRISRCVCESSECI